MLDKAKLKDRNNNGSSECREWDEWDGRQWVAALLKSPALAKHCSWDKLDGADWAYLLAQQPQFAERCEWGKLRTGHWSFLVKRQPQFNAQRGAHVLNKAKVPPASTARSSQNAETPAAKHHAVIVPYLTSGRRLRRLGGTCMGY